MKHLRFVSFVAVFVLVSQGACGPKLPAPAALPSPAAPSAAPVPVSTEVPAVAPPTSASATFSGPEMQMGSTFLYVDGSLLVPVPPGAFTMGAGGSDNPVHVVTLKGFWIYRTEVTNEQYAWCVEAGRCSPPNLDDNQAYTDRLRQNEPVVGVTWDQGSAYCEFVHGRYPTEAEWEKAARGPDANVYPWGNDPPTRELLNYKNFVGKTTLVTAYPQGKSYYDLLNTAGNVFEWVGDWYDALYYRKGPAEDPPGPAGGTQRSVRSSGYRSNEDQVPLAIRFRANPIDHRRDLGFRCVVEDPAYFAPFCQLQVVYGKNAPGGGGPGGPKAACDPAQIVRAEDCGAGNTQINNVHLDSDPPTEITSVTGGDACTPPLTDPTDTAGHTCPLGLKITITAICKVPASSSGDPGCPSNLYELSPDGTTCKAKGFPGQCPLGYEFDPAAMCCKAQAGAAAALCASGYHAYSGSCVPDSGTLYDLPPDSVTTTSGKPCQPGGGPGCPPTDPTYPNCTGQPGKCPPGQDWVCVGDKPYQRCGCSVPGCLAPNTLIDTPEGTTPVERLKVGDAVWSVDGKGLRIATTILKTSRVPVSASHLMTHLSLVDGRQLWVSPSHPTSDGRTFGQLQVGDLLDGAPVALAELVPYDMPATFDLLPDSATGFYWANGILIGSTLTN